MSLLNSILIMLAAFIGIYLEASCDGTRHLLGAQFDVLPSLMVYAALCSSLTTMTTLAIAGGLCFDSLSANPLGVTVLPLFIVGSLVYMRRGLILQDQLYAQFVLGATASAVVPALTMLMLLSARQSPIFGWGSIWQLIVLASGGALLTPVCFFVFNRLNNALSYRPVVQSSFRPDREIRRSRK